MVPSKTPSAPSERVVGLGGIAFGGGPVGSSVRSFAFAAVATTVLKDGNEAAAGAHGRTEESRMAATGTFPTCPSGLTMSVHRGRPEVAEPRSKRRD
jgi:hypothetical protein